MLWMMAVAVSNHRPPNAALNSTPRITHHANNKATLSGGFVYRLNVIC